MATDTTAWNKEKVIDTLKPLLQLGMSVTKACKYAGIPQPTVATWLMKDPELQLKIKIWQSQVSLKARQNIVAKILGKNAPKEYQDELASVELSSYWLKTKEKDEFSERSEVLTADTTLDTLNAEEGVVDVDELSKEISNKLRAVKTKRKPK